MIMKANKQIGFIYKNNESIDKILKDGDVVFERGFLRERTSTTLPITFGGVGKNLKDYKIYGNTVQSKLPSGYTQVDFIESSGTQYIDTGLKSTPNSKFDFEFTSTKAVGAEYEQVLGSQVAATKDRIYILIGGTNNIQLQFPYDGNTHLYMNNDGTFTTSSSSTKLLYITKDVKNRIIFDIPNRALTVNEYTSFSTSTYDLTSSDYNILIFNRNDTAVPTTRLAKGKLYNFKWYESNVLVRDFIPCYRNSDNEVGLYDLVNNVFYTNQGTGVFTYGSVAPTPDAPIEMVSCGDLITDSQDANYGKYKIPVNVRSDNLISQTIYQTNTNLSDNGELTSNNNYFVLKQTNIKPLSKYKLSENQTAEMTGTNTTPIRVCAYDSNDNFLSLVLKNVRTEAKRYVDEFVVPTNTDYILISFRNTDSNIELVESIDTNIYLDEPLRKLGEYSDYIDFKNGKVVRRIKETLLDDNITWITSRFANEKRIYTSSSNIDSNMRAVNSNSQVGYLLSNQYKAEKLENILALSVRYGIGISSTSYFSILNQDYASTTDFLQALHDNPIVLDYVLATPTEEDIELPNIPTIDGNNTLNIETEITPSQVYIKYKSNE